MARPKWTSTHTLIACVSVVVLSWLIGTPRWAGPDEPSHAVASAALVRGHIEGELADLEFRAETFDVPSMVGDPDPVCFALQPDAPASCAGEPTDSTRLVPRYSSSSNYPIWGHVLPGLASFVPSPHWFAYLARLVSALPVVALLVAALVRCRRTPWLFTGLLMGLTPITWFSMSIISPSALAIAGGAALWAALLVPTARRHDLLFVAGWLALSLPRREGPLWATLVVLLACLATGVLPSDIWRRRSVAERTALAIAALLAFLPTLTNGVDTLNTTLAFSPLLLVVAEGGTRVAGRRAQHLAARSWVALLAAAAVLAIAAANILRPGGPDIDTTWRIVTGTGRHLRQLVGLLGWLDTPVPESMLLLWWMVFGGLAMLAMLGRPGRAALAAGAFATMLVTSWILELGTGDPSGTYWQGRYSMPFMIGVPMLLAGGVDIGSARTRLARVTMHRTIWLVWNLSFAAALRRWGVGVNGSVYPWRWDTWSSPLAPVILLAAHALATWLLVSPRDLSGDAAQQSGDTNDSPVLSAHP